MENRDRSPKEPQETAGAFAPATLEHLGAIQEVAAGIGGVISLIK